MRKIQPNRAIGICTKPNLGPIGENGKNMPMQMTAMVKANTGAEAMLCTNGILRVRIMCTISVCVSRLSTNQAFFQTGWFVESLLTQTLIVHMIRTRKIPFVQSIAAAPVLALTTLVICIGMVLPFSPIGPKFGFVQIPMALFGWIFLTVFTYAVLTQFVKTLYIRRYKRWL